MANIIYYLVSKNSLWPVKKYLTNNKLIFYNWQVKIYIWSIEKTIWTVLFGQWKIIFGQTFRCGDFGSRRIDFRIGFFNRKIQFLVNILKIDWDGRANHRLMLKIPFFVVGLLTIYYFYWLNIYLPNRRDETKMLANFFRCIVW